MTKIIINPYNIRLKVELMMGENETINLLKKKVNYFASFKRDKEYIINIDYDTEDDIDTTVSYTNKKEFEEDFKKLENAKI